MATATKKRKEEAYPWKAGASSGHDCGISALRLQLSLNTLKALSLCCRNHLTSSNKLFKIMADGPCIELGLIFWARIKLISGFPL
jgi:hypothetical protein